MERDKDDDAAGGPLDGRSQWLWSPTADNPGADETEEEILVGTEETLDQWGGLLEERHSFSQRITSTVMPLGISPSGRPYQSIQHFRTECLKPTTSIRSHWLQYNSFPKPPQLQLGLSLTSLTPIAQQRRSHQQSTSSVSPRTVLGHFKRRK
ncbi:P4 protein [Panicum distortion mosaic virus]|uniref:P4 protein n=1 Tax=Panicum distortion mosaic virus TaxID=2420235 RepID=A0AAD1DAT3_9VIRU|nr:P4 protein [Panicum distortion mosaic virus]